MKLAVEVKNIFTDVLNRVDVKVNQIEMFRTDCVRQGFLVKMATFLRMIFYSFVFSFSC